MKKIISFMVLCVILVSMIPSNFVSASSGQTGIVVNCNTYYAGLNKDFTGGSAFSISAGSRVHIEGSLYNTRGNLVYYVRTSNGKYGYISSSCLKVETAPSSTPSISMDVTPSASGPQITIRTDGTELWYTVRRGGQVIAQEPIRLQVNTWDFSRWNLSPGTYTFEAQSNRNGIASECKAYTFTITGSTAVRGADGAINWANSKLGSHEYNFYCVAFVYRAFYHGAGINSSSYINAKTAANHLVRNTDRTPPRGAVVFYDYWATLNGKYANYGHIAISLGDGRIIHAFGRSGVVITSIDIGLPYLGWGEWR